MRRFWLIPAVIALVVGGSAAPAQADDIAGRLVDTTCYKVLGREAAPETDLVKCSIAGAQKGQRLALVTDTGTVYLVTGLLTQNGNKQLVPLINRPVVVTGVVTVGDLSTADLLGISETEAPNGSATGSGTGNVTGDASLDASLTKLPVAPITSEPEPDTRRNPSRDNEVIEKTVKTGDFREGDPRTGTPTTIDAISVLDVVNRVRVP